MSLDVCEVAIIAAVNDDSILRANLAASPDVTSGRCRLVVQRGYSSASSAYADGARLTQAQVLVFAHQDVYLPERWTDRLNATIDDLDAVDPNWGVLGVFGVMRDGHTAGRVWSSGLGMELRGEARLPAPVVSLDEVLLVIRPSSSLRFDECMPGFHLYGTDIVQTALAAGWSAYAVHAPIIHNSRPIRYLDSSYARCYRAMRTKWRSQLPIPNCIVPLTRLGGPLWWHRMRMIKRELLRQGPKTQRATDPAAISLSLGYSGGAA